MGARFSSLADTMKDGYSGLTIGGSGAPADLTDDSVSYANCDAARAAGVAPIYRGQPGYASYLDADNDGIACEPWHPGRWGHRPRWKRHR